MYLQWSEVKSGFGAGWIREIIFGDVFTLRKLCIGTHCRAGDKMIDLGNAGDFFKHELGAKVPAVCFLWAHPNVVLAWWGILHSTWTHRTIWCTSFGIACDKWRVSSMQWSDAWKGFPPGLLPARGSITSRRTSLDCLGSTQLDTGAQLALSNLPLRPNMLNPWARMWQSYWWMVSVASCGMITAIIELVESYPEVLKPQYWPFQLQILVPQLQMRGSRIKRSVKGWFCGARYPTATKVLGIVASVLWMQMQRWFQWFHLFYLGVSSRIFAELRWIVVHNGTVCGIRFGWFHHATSRFFCMFSFWRTCTDGCFLTNFMRFGCLCFASHSHLGSVLESNIFIWQFGYTCARRDNDLLEYI